MSRDIVLSDTSKWLPYSTEHCLSSFCKEKAKELRASGEYARVKLGSYLKEDGKTFCKIYVQLIRQS